MEIQWKLLLYVINTCILSLASCLSSPVNQPVMESSRDDKAQSPVVILDCGSSLCRAGFSNDLSPQVIMPTLIGCPKDSASREFGTVKHFIGDTALAIQDELSLKFPIEFGYVSDWDAIELLWHDMLVEKLKCKPENHPFLVAVKDHSPKQQYEKILQILFETHDVPCAFISPSSTLNLLACELSSGTVVELGDSDCIPAPIQDGYALVHAMQRTMISGRSLTSYLQKLLSQRGVLDCGLSSHRMCAKKIKEQLCYVVLNYEKEIENFQNEACFTLPDGKEITLGKERFQCPEGFFQQKLLGFEMPNLAECVFMQIKRCHGDLHRNLFSNIILCGGSSFFSGLPERLQKKIQCLAHAEGIYHKINVSHCPHRHSTFHGAASLASTDIFPSSCVSKEFYDENGGYVATKKYLSPIH